MNNYEINEDTLYLVCEDESNYIYEGKNVYDSNICPNKIIEHSCNYFGSSLDGRQKGSKNLIGYTYKVPIIIEETKEIIFFPIVSPRLKNCSWISLNNIDSYQKSLNGVIVYFKNGINVEIPMSYNVFENQLLRATRLNLVLKNRKKEISLK